MSQSRIQPKQYAVALHQAIFESAPTDQDKILDNFVGILKENGDLSKLDEIEQDFFAYEQQVKHIQVANVISARELTKEEEAKIIKELNEYVGTKVELKKQVDEGLVGGVVIKIGDELIDGSLRRSLKDLKERLTK